MSFSSDMMDIAINELFGFGNLIKSNQSAKKSKSVAAIPDSKIEKYVDDNYVPQLRDIIMNEYKKNKSKYNKIAKEAAKKARGDEYDPKYDRVDFDIEFPLNFVYDEYDCVYKLFADFFQTDQDLGFDIENDILKPFFSAIEPKVKQVLGKNFVGLEGALDDTPGEISIVFKFDKSQLQN